MVMETSGDCISAILFAAGSTVVLQGIVIEGSGVMVHGISLYYFSQLHVSLQIFQSKMFLFSNEIIIDCLMTWKSIYNPSPFMKISRDTGPRSP